MVSIYCLADPRWPSKVRYIGQTQDPLSGRLARHLKDARRGSRFACHHWIRELLTSGRTPLIRLIDRTDRANRYAAEKSTIARLREKGAQLLNVDRLNIKPSTRRKMRAAKLGRMWSITTRRKMSASQRRTWREKREARYGRRIGHHVSSATRRKLSLAAKGRIISPAQRGKISRSLKGQKQSLKTRLKRRDSVRRAWQSPKLRQQQSERTRKRFQDPEQRRKLSIATKLAWTRR
jgi:hypothetical protein